MGDAGGVITDGGASIVGNFSWLLQVSPAVVTGSDPGDDSDDPTIADGEDDDDGGGDDDVGMFCRCGRPLVAGAGVTLLPRDLFVEGDIVES